MVQRDMAKPSALETLIADPKVRLRAEQGAKAAGLPPQALADFVEALPSLLWEAFATSYDPEASSPATFARMVAKARALDLRKALERAGTPACYDTTLDGVATGAEGDDGEALVRGIAAEGCDIEGDLIARDGAEALEALEAEALAEGGFSIRDVAIYMALRDDDSVENAARVAETVGLGHVPPGTPADKVAWFKARSVRAVASKVRAYVRAYIAEFGDK